MPATVGANTWNVSAVAGSDNVTTLFDVNPLADGDTIRIWGVTEQTYEGGITINVPNVLIQRWEGSPARPLITNTSGDAPAIKITKNNATLQGLNISGNSYDDFGGGVYALGLTGTHLKNFTVTDCVFTGNNVTVTSSDDCGGAMDIYYVDNASITNTLFENNSAGEHGGAVFIGRSKDLIITDTVFRDNSAGARGGAIYCRWCPHPVLIRTTFDNNTDGTWGGGLSFYDSDNANLTDSTFTNNTAGDLGGGAYFEFSSGASLTNTTFENNTAVTYGGGAYFKSSLPAVIKNCLFNNLNNLYAESSNGARLNETTPIYGTNIAGGPYLGGNVWLRDANQNISERGTDANYDGICDTPLTISGLFGTDFYPLMYRNIVSVNSTPAGAFIIVDGANISETTNHSFYLMTGDHTITVNLDEYVTPTEQTLPVVAGTPQSVSFTLQKDGSTVSVSSTPAGAFIIVDGVNTTNTTDDSVYLRSGDHTITLNLNGYITPTEQTVTIVPETPQSVSFTLDREPTPEPESGGGNTHIGVGASQNLKAGETASYSLNRGAVYQVTITAAKDISKEMITVESRDSPESSVDAPDTTVYEYEDVTLYQTENADLAGGTFSFKVSKSWLSSHGYTKGDVVLLHFNGASWDELPTELIDEDKSYYYYQAATPSFSWFAIGIAEGATILPETTTTATATALPTSEQIQSEPAPSVTPTAPVSLEVLPLPEENNLSTSMIVVLLLVLGLAGIVGGTLIRKKQKAKYPDWWYEDKK